MKLPLNISKPTPNRATIDPYMKPLETFSVRTDNTVRTAVNSGAVHMMKETFDACVSPSAMFCKKKNREPPNTPPPARHSSSFRLRAKKLWEEIGHTAT